MYPEIPAIISYAKSKKATRPLIMCEYSHAMGNSNGTIAEYWDAVHSLKGLQGGFIWEMWDHGLNQRLEDGTIRAAYGGDYGETKHDGNFVCDGMFSQTVHLNLLYKRSSRSHPLSKLLPRI